MSWSYSGDPKTSDLDAVRVTIGDTDSDSPILSDEEINFALFNETKVLPAAIKCCEFIIAKTAPEVDYKIGPETISGSQRITNYNNLLRALRKSKELNYAVPSADVSEDRLFEIGMFDCKRI